MISLLLCDLQTTSMYRLRTAVDKNTAFATHFFSFKCRLDFYTFDI